MKRKIYEINPLAILYYFCLTVLTVRLSIFWALIYNHTPAVYVQSIHIHHFVFGFIFLILSIATFKLHRCPRWLFELLLGISLGLVFDEFIYWTTLDFNYWDLGNFFAVLFISALSGYLSLLNPRPVRIVLRRQYHKLKPKQYSIVKHLFLPWGSFAIILLILFRKM